MAAAILILVSVFSAMETFGADKIRVGVLDTGLDITDRRFSHLLCPGNVHRDFTDTTLADKHGHGTHIVSLIKEFAGLTDGYCLVIVKYWDLKASEDEHERSLVKGIKYLADLKVDIVNFSGGGEGYSYVEESAMISASKILWVVAAGNDGKELDAKIKYYPACYHLRNVISVGALDAKGARATYSNYGHCVKVWEIGHTTGTLHGTSIATAIHTGKILARRLKSHQ